MKSHFQTIWLDQSLEPWEAKCDVVVHASAAAYRRSLGPGSERTSGCSTIQLEQGRVVLRRIDLSGNAEECFSDSLPHELIHIVLADRFTERRIPPWADEGIAMLAESPDKLQRRLNELRAVFAANRIMPLRELLQLDNGPAPELRDAFYGQSVTLAGLLLEKGTPEQLLRFVKAGQQHGYEAALGEVYAIESWTDLESEWRTYAGSQRLRLLANHSIPGGCGTSDPASNPLQLAADSR